MEHSSNKRKSNGVFRQIITAVVVTGAIIGGLGLFKYTQIVEAMAKGKSRQPPPVAVTTAIVSSEDWPRTFESIGTLEAVNGVMLSAEENGRVAVSNFTSGSFVSQGAVLLELDSDVELAALRGAKARLELSELNANRQQVLRQKVANSQMDLDTALAELRNARADVDRLSALIARRKVVAPFSGMVGISKVNVGEIINVGTPIVSLQAFEQLRVNFALPQQLIGSLSVGMRVELFVDAFGERVFGGTLTAIDSVVDVATRTVGLQATLSNRDGLLRPGMFARVVVVLPEAEHVLAIPASSIKYAPYGNSVYVILANGDASNTEPKADDVQLRDVQSTTIRLGRRFGDRICVLSGLKVGDEVVSSGVFRLYPDAKVLINNTVQPGNELNPNPSNT